MKLQRCLLFLSFFYSNAILAAGGWHSGGARLNQNLTIPWLNGKDIATYCFVIDEASFGVDLEFARKSFQRAKDYWVKEFQDLTSRSDESYKILFEERSCSEDIDLYIQLGVLSLDQQQYIGDVHNTAGIAVRTSYNEETQTGKGFLYISPEKGVLALSWGLMPYRWSLYEGAVLEKVMMHELGHILGLSHSTSFDIMNPLLIKKMIGVAFSAMKMGVSRLKSGSILSLHPFEGFFGPKKNGEIVIHNTNPFFKELSHHQGIDSKFFEYIKVSWCRDQVSFSASAQGLNHFQIIAVYSGGKERWLHRPLISHLEQSGRYLFSFINRRSLLFVFPEFTIEILYDGLKVQYQDSRGVVIYRKKFFCDSYFHI